MRASSFLELAPGGRPVPPPPVLGVGEHSGRALPLPQPLRPARWPSAGPGRLGGERAVGGKG